jgi:hypothetical protein
MGLVSKMKTQPQKFIPVGPGGFHTVGQYRGQDSSVFQQGIIDITDHRTISVPGLLFIVEIVSTVVIAELFIDSSPQGIATGMAGSFFCMNGFHNCFFQAIKLLQTDPCTNVFYPFSFGKKRVKTG